MHIGFPQLLDKLVFVRTSAAPYLPPGGRGTAKRWMRNGDTLPFAMRSIQTEQPFPIYLFNEVHTNMEHIAVPHPPQCALLKPLPPGGRYCVAAFQHFKIIPEGDTLSHILYLISPISPVILRGLVHWKSSSKDPKAYPWASQRVSSSSRICALVLEVEWSSTTAPLWVRGSSLAKAASGVGWASLFQST